MPAFRGAAVALSQGPRAMLDSYNLRVVAFDEEEGSDIRADGSTAVQPRSFVMRYQAIDVSTH